MKEPEHEGIPEMLKDVFPPVDTELRRDLWPAMLRKMESEAIKKPTPWFDWVLAGCLAGGVVIFPKFLLLVAYHL